MYPWTKDPNDPKKIIVTDDRGHKEQVAYCASPAVANLILHRCDNQPVLLEACRNAVATYEVLEMVGVDKELPGFKDCRAFLLAAIAAADPTTKEPTP